MKKFGAACAAIALIGLTGTAMAQKAPPTPEQRAKSVAENRHALFHVIGAAFAPAGGMLRGGPYDAAAIKLSGERLEVLGGMIKQMTAVDTSKLVPGTGAKPIVWTDRADFESKADALIAAAVALKSSTDEASAKKAAQGVGGACKSCHDKFREEDDH
jgi:cytochrome c556